MTNMKSFYEWYGVLFDKLWNEIIINRFYCKHKECPHKDCMWHMYSIKPNYFSDDEFPYYMPRNNEEMKSCMSYMDI